MKKVTLQDISNSLNISRITVWKVLNNKDGVAESTRHKIIKKAVELGYGKIDSNLINSALINAKSNNNISVIVSRPESTTFWIRIINQIASELNRNSFNLIYNPLTEYEENNFQLPAIIKNNEVSGIIVINIYDKQAIKQLCNTKIPKVFLDVPFAIPLHDIEGDIILLEGIESIYNITDSIIKKGRRKIGFIGDIMYSKTMYDRFSGFLKALQQNNIELDTRYCFTGSIPLGAYITTIKNYIYTLDDMPEAFICANDYISVIVITLLNERNINVPEDISVTGYDDNGEFVINNSFLTTVHVQNELLGKRLVRQLMYRIENPESDYETIYINTQVIFRKST